ncbi:DUF1254 domain-containing protein [Streptomyces sp. NBC_00893]|uniref:DUF1254 domain-containing protein n=1 Tax=Streptomyces sp. NBC_00893 TaxID=2975862 RepID=UPI00224D7936|nr:DUF1254 domain-containing protein [Streptomyces sp. NBC_00893]MCX4848224.1 DUF1254 domain-containing protein [Streptomyces sp. NBC_00893]
MELVALAAEAYVYGYPLVRDLSVVEGAMYTGYGPLPPAPFNHFAHADRPVPPDTPFVSVGDDTVRSLAHLDLSGGPVLLHVPGPDGTYRVLQFVDAWTDSFAYVGRRSTGTRAGDWLVVPPGWAGRVPGGVLGAVDAPTSVVTVIGRSDCDDGDDGGGSDGAGRVRAFQEQLTVTHVEPGTHRTGLPAPDPDVPEPLRFFEQLRVWMADFPPSAPDRAYQDRFQPLGLLEEGASPYVRADAFLVRALAEGAARGGARVEEADRADAVRAGWVMEPHLFDYNLDHYGVGTIDSPEWRIADREASYLTRAVAARSALWGVHGYEAVYARALCDAGGGQLNGAHSYVLRFEGRPPAEAGWSLAAHSMAGYGVGGYGVAGYGRGGSRIGEGLAGRGPAYAEDGSLTVRVQRERPDDPVAAVNWLPAPEGDFRFVLRLRAPGAGILDGTYGLPAVERVR